MKKIFLSLSFLFLCLTIFAVDLVNEPSVQAFRDAKSLFLNKEYGKALNKCEDAITFRKENVEDELEIISKAISSKQVQKAGDKLVKGDVIATIYSNNKSTNESMEMILDAYLLTKENVKKEPIVIKTIRG